MEDINEIPEQSREAVFQLQAILEADSYEVLNVAPYVLRGAVVRAGLSANDLVTMTQIKQAIQAFLQAPAK
ncbi:hypothetical protein EV586_102422 [Tumebacillus sp. BK434]|uniref:hypothetical protein n=1 Tax=Tumebacillus sp. BK434 TaxID=2512169 RepID=UPI0010460C1F|nr:hypothetical protein [Tumebacillus sp. BK434]TCP57974.1 hypothetical protein EV586_102422 [Tumebacillus sp. BK434]